MKTIIHKADTRGKANYGWLDTRYTFSFANYYDPDRVHFGTLRVLNDDWVQGGQGFGRHPHDNMEIVTIPLEGEIEHQDSMGNTFSIKKNDVQIMSAGTGIFHSEYNKLSDVPLKLLQIWVLPEKKNIKPRYDQKTYNPGDRLNKWQLIVSPADTEAVWINQDAYFSLLSTDSIFSTEYKLRKPGNGIYIFIINGSLAIDGLKLEKRDGAGIWETPSVKINTDGKSEILLMEIPMI